MNSKDRSGSLSGPWHGAVVGNAYIRELCLLVAMFQSARFLGWFALHDAWMGLAGTQRGLFFCGKIVVELGCRAPTEEEAVLCGV